MSGNLHARQAYTSSLLGKVPSLVLTTFYRKHTMVRVKFRFTNVLSFCEGENV